MDAVPLHDMSLSDQLSSSGQTPDSESIRPLLSDDNFVFLDRTGATIPIPRCLSRLRYFWPCTMESMQPSDIATIKVAARDALTMLGAESQQQGDDDLHRRFFKTTQSQAAVNFILDLVREWLYEFLDDHRNSTCHWPPVKLVRDGSYRCAIAAVVPQRHEIRFFSRFFEDHYPEVANCPRSHGMTKAYMEELRAIIIIIHELVHYLSHYHWQDFLRLAPPALAQRASSLGLNHITDLEIVERSRLKWKIFPVQYNESLLPPGWKRSKSRCGRTCYVEKSEKRSWLPPTPIGLDAYSWRLYISSLGTLNSSWGKRTVGAYSPPITEFLAKFEDGKIAALLNADNYACYVSEFAAKYLDKKALTVDSIREMQQAVLRSVGKTEVDADIHAGVALERSLRRLLTRIMARYRAVLKL